MRSRLVRMIPVPLAVLAAVLCTTAAEALSPSAAGADDTYQTRLTQLLQDLDRERAAHTPGTADGSAPSRSHFAPTDADTLAKVLQPASGSHILVVLGTRDRAGRLTIARLLDVGAESPGTAPRKSSHSRITFERSSFTLLPAEEGSLELPTAWTPPLETVTVDTAMEAMARPGTAAFVIATTDGQTGGAARTLAVVPDSLHIDVGGSQAVTSNARPDAVSVRPGRDAEVAETPAPPRAVASIDPGPSPAELPAPSRPDHPPKHERTPEEKRAEEAARQASFNPPSDNLTPDQPPP